MEMLLLAALLLQIGNLFAAIVLFIAHWIFTRPLYPSRRN